MPDADTIAAKSQSFLLSGPSDGTAFGMLPARGDLAHIDLAGKIFVPHYAVPMPHDALRAMPIMMTAKRDATPVGALSEGGQFDVLDLSGGWAWGCAPGGPVGYVPIDDLIARERTEQG